VPNKVRVKIQSSYTSGRSQAQAGEHPSLPSSYLPMCTRPRWVCHPCRVGEYPCGGYGQVGARQASWYASARRQVDKQRHLPIVLVQHGSGGEKNRGERGREKQGRWGTRGKKGRRERARPPSTQPSTRRCPPSAPPRPSARRLLPRRWRGGLCARLAACARAPHGCHRACAAGPGRGVPE